MKSHPPHKPSAAPPLTPRQAALLKLTRIGWIGGTIVLAVAIIVGGAALGDRWFAKDPLNKKNSGKPFEFRDPVLNTTAAPGPAPEGMVWIPGGEFWMGDEELDLTLERHLVYVDGFWMDTHEVTNEQFAKFVAATKYKTVVERPVDPKEFPKAPKELLQPWSFVFQKPPETQRFASLAQCQYECAKPTLGACWKHPEGPDSNIKGREKHPVVHICYEDAVAYCQWAGKRLPTEAEWEFASRGGLDRKNFPWGDDLQPGKKWVCNIWQGQFPYENTKEDGYETTAPVGSYDPNGYGLYDMAGNVWEWCADWYQPDYYTKSADPDWNKAVRNPLGPASGYDPLEPGFPKRVQRGGSFLCAEGACERYYCAARGKGEINSSGIQIGFRCAK